jgi:hypothetical protein
MEMFKAINEFTMLQIPEYVVLGFLGVCVLWAIVIIGTAWEHKKGGGKHG